MPDTQFLKIHKRMTAFLDFMFKNRMTCTIEVEITNRKHMDTQNNVNIYSQSPSNEYRQLPLVKGARVKTGDSEDFVGDLVIPYNIDEIKGWSDYYKTAFISIVLQKIDYQLPDISIHWRWYNVRNKVTNNQSICCILC